MEIEEKAKKHTRPPKFKYTSKEFLDYLEEMARKGLTDRSIAYSLLERFGETLTPQKFSEFKNEKKRNGEPTERGKKISEALARGREKTNLLARDTFLKAALGLKKTKDVYRVYSEIKCECGGSNIDCPLCYGTGKIISEKKAVIQEVEREMPPNLQALSTWLFNHDPEWKQAVIEGKKLDITSGGKEIAPPRILTKKEAKEYLKEIENEY